MTQGTALAPQPLALFDPSPDSTRSREQGIALVTGAAGFIGSHLAEQLLSENFQVIGLDCFTDYYPRAVKEANLTMLRHSGNFRFVEGDLCTFDVQSLLTRKGVRYIFHIAGQAGVRPSWGNNFDPYVTHNIVATQRLLEACREVELERFIFASSSSVYGDAEKFPTDEEQLPRPLSPYGVTKLAAEHLCFLYAKQFQLPVVALRYFSVYGPRQRPDMAFRIFIDAILREQPIPLLGDGEQTREFTFVTDIVQANLAAARASDVLGRVYNIGGGARVTMNEALDVLRKVTGKSIRVEYQPRAPGDHRHGGADISRAQRELHYAPRVGLEEGLRQQFEWQRAVAHRESPVASLEP